MEPVKVAEKILHTSFWELYSDEREILGEALFMFDTGDPFGWCQGWRWALADYLVWDMGEYVYGYRSEHPEEDRFEYQTLLAMNATVEQCRYALKILDRYRVWLELADMTY